MSRKLDDILALRFSANPGPHDGVFLRMIASGLCFMATFWLGARALGAVAGTSAASAGAVGFLMLLGLGVAAFILEAELEWGPRLSLAPAALAATCLLLAQHFLHA